MPITRPNVNLYSINNLALDYDPGSGRYGLSLECPRADAFTLCLGKNLPLADPEKLGLTEEELRRLHNGQSMGKGAIGSSALRRGPSMPCLCSGDLRRIRPRPSRCGV